MRPNPAQELARLFLAAHDAAERGEDPSLYEPAIQQILENPTPELVAWMLERGWSRWLH